MNKEQIQDVFNRCGLGKLGEKLSYKLWIKGIGEEYDEQSLEDFLLSYDLRDDCGMLADEFQYHLQIFLVVVRNEDLRAALIYL